MRPITSADLQEVFYRGRADSNLDCYGWAALTDFVNALLPGAGGYEPREAGGGSRRVEADDPEERTGLPHSRDTLESPADWRPSEPPDRAPESHGIIRGTW